MSPKLVVNWKSAYYGFLAPSRDILLKLPENEDSILILLSGSQVRTELLSEDTSERVDYSLCRTSIHNNYTRAVTVLLSSNRIDNLLKRADKYFFLQACRHSCLEVIRYCLEDDLISEEQFRLGIEACISRSQHRALALLLQSGRVDSLSACVDCCSIGDLAVLSVLLASEVWDPSEQESFVLRLLCANGRTEAVKLLLDDGRADPTSRNNEAISLASAAERTAVLDLLLADKRIPWTVKFQYGLRWKHVLLLVCCFLLPVIFLS